MSSIVISGDTSGSVTLQAPAIAGSTVVTLPTTSMNIGTGGGSVATNTAFGASALAANTTGSNNVAVGYQAGFANTTGEITAVGSLALENNTTGASNTAIGVTALRTNTSGTNNSGLGRGALRLNTTGSFNTGVGNDALYSNTTASNNTAVGYQAGYANTTGTVTAVGTQALQANTTGDYNTAMGSSALLANTTGPANSAFGLNALTSNTTGGYNTGVGVQALNANTTANYNTAVGYQAGYTSTTATNNTLIGAVAGTALTGGGNTFVGAGVGQLVTTGTKNTIIGTYNGNQGGLDIRTANNNIVLSDGDGNPRGYFDPNGRLIVGAVSTSESVNSFQYFPGSGANTETLLILVNERNNSGGETFIVNRQAADGTLIQFRQANTNEGSISVSGTTVSYNGGHLSRWAQTTAPKDDTLVKGTVLSNLDEMNVYTKDGQPVDNEQLNKVKVSDVEGDANVAGVFVNWTHDEQHNVDEINMAMTGDMIIRIAQGTTVARGDLLMSAGDGTAKPQGDDIVRSKTVAKVTSTHVTCTYADGSYCVPCVLMAC